LHPDIASGLKRLACAGSDGLFFRAVRFAISSREDIDSLGVLFLVEAKAESSGLSL
jgi:hypothetical protein